MGVAILINYTSIQPEYFDTLKSSREDTSVYEYLKQEIKA